MFSKGKIGRKQRRGRTTNQTLGIDLDCALLPQLYPFQLFKMLAVIEL